MHDLHPITVTGFLDQLASRSPTPGGGSVSALVGALAAALVGMVSRLNDSKTGEPGVLHELIEPAERLRARLTALIQEDTRGFEGLMAAWQLPKADPTRPAEITKAAEAATLAPLEMMSNSLEIMKLALKALSQSKSTCRSDAVITVLLAQAAIESAAQNVWVNLPQLDGPRAEYFRAEAERVARAAAAFRR